MRLRFTNRFRVPWFSPAKNRPEAEAQGNMADDTYDETGGEVRRTSTEYEYKTIHIDQVVSCT